MKLFDQARLTAGIGFHQFDTAGKGTFFGDDDEFSGNSFDPLTNTYIYLIIHVYQLLRRAGCNVTTP